MICSVTNCSNTNSLVGIKFYPFPKDEELRSKWVTFCGRDFNDNIDKARMCSDHFKATDFERDMQFEMGFKKRSSRILKPDAIPTILLEPVPKVKLVMSKSGRPYKVFDEEPVVDYEEELEDKIELLEAERDALKAENSSLKKDLVTKDKTIKFLRKRVEILTAANNKYDNGLKAIFTPGQIMKICSGGKKRLWLEEDVASSIKLYRTSGKAYIMLLEKQYPLPSVRTLQSWVNRMEISPGVITQSLTLLREAKHLNGAQRLCVLSYDKMFIKRSPQRTSKATGEIPPKNYVEVAMLRGLVSNWKQPVYYAFDCEMTKEVLFDVINQIRACNYRIMAVVTDIGNGNRPLFTDLGVSHDHPWFDVDNQRIFAFSNVPYLMKSFRNNFLDYGFMINGKEVKKEIVEKILSIKSPEIRKMHRISGHHLNAVGADRRKLSFAIHLLSHTMATVITKAAEMNFLDSENWRECVQLFQIINDWFDIFNVRDLKGVEYNVAMDKQKSILSQMTNMIHNLRIIDSYIFLPFQTGILQTNNALNLLCEELKKDYEHQAILTYSLNQDAIANFFTAIRWKGTQPNRPNRVEFLYRMRAYLLGNKEILAGQKVNIMSELNKPERIKIPRQSIPKAAASQNKANKATNSKPRKRASNSPIQPVQRSPKKKKILPSTLKESLPSTTKTTTPITITSIKVLPNTTTTTTTPITMPIIKVLPNTTTTTTTPMTITKPIIKLLPSTTTTTTTTPLTITKPIIKVLPSTTTTPIKITTPIITFVCKRVNLDKQTPTSTAVSLKPNENNSDNKDS